MLKRRLSKRFVLVESGELQDTGNSIANTITVTSAPNDTSTQDSTSSNSPAAMDQSNLLKVNTNSLGSSTAASLK